MQTNSTLENQDILVYNQENGQKSIGLLIFLGSFYLSFGLLLCTSYIGWALIIFSVFYFTASVLAHKSFKPEGLRFLKLYKINLLALIVIDTLLSILLIFTIAYIFANTSKCEKREIEACKVAKELRFLVVVVCIVMLTVGLGTLSMLISFYSLAKCIENPKTEVKFEPVNMNDASKLT